MADAKLFRRFAKGSKGKASLYITPALRKRYVQGEEATDEELAAADEGGETVARVEDEAWQLVLTRVRSVQARMLEDGGIDQLAKYLRSLNHTAEFESTTDMATAIIEYVKEYNKTAKQFKWKYDHADRLQAA